jgi:hypothetical protein
VTSDQAVATGNASCWSGTATVSLVFRIQSKKHDPSCSGPPLHLCNRYFSTAQTEVTLPPAISTFPFASPRSGSPLPPFYTSLPTPPYHHHLAPTCPPPPSKLKSGTQSSGPCHNSNPHHFLTNPTLLQTLWLKTVVSCQFPQEDALPLLHC